MIRLFRKPAPPKLSEAQIASKAARYLSQRNQTCAIRRDQMTRRLARFVDEGGCVEMTPREMIVAQSEAALRGRAAHAR